ncbi:zinc finger protein [Plasmodium cynomolgi strain B]|uniref:Zinc finger protein n=1 Tax=Plasmodium cynomolgi (strain B) TaxID=1120755 RepID=K6VF81_PLACD|nr:zinc finger protein [Plasmodium cynomolgi strain B]GAB67942.1 zinc finger protein [Plasmodium cynomolgi strain B]
MERIEDQAVLEKIANITGAVIKNASSVKKDKKGKRKKRKSAPTQEKKQNSGANNKKAKKVTGMFDDYKIQKREICKFFFKKGKCMHNEKCTYSHDVTPIYKISKLCKFLVKGTCKKENCIFSHDYKLFFCRNNVIYNSCCNPQCKFKHIKIDSSINNADQYNIEVDNILSKDDKIRFLYNNKNYLMELLINKYHKFDKFEEKNINNLTKKETYPWFINGIIDLIKLDYKFSKADAFLKLVDNYKDKFLNTKGLVPSSIENSQHQDNKGLYGDSSISADYTKMAEEYVDGSNADGEKGTHLNSNNPSATNDNNVDGNSGEGNFSDYKFYSSDEEEDYTKYLNKYFEIDG